MKKIMMANTRKSITASAFSRVVNLETGKSSSGVSSLSVCLSVIHIPPSFFNMSVIHCACCDCSSAVVNSNSP